MAKGAAKTGSQPTVLLAIEQAFPGEQCVLRDPFALQILSPSEKAMTMLLRIRMLRIG